jgi:Cysteine-rich secretory protein family
VSVTLENSSHWMSNDMATHNGSSHTDSLGRDPYTRMVAFGYPYYPWGENIAGGFGTAQSVFNAWVNSPEHLVNMVNPAFVVMGIGRAYNSGSSFGWYWTTDFGGVADQIINPNPTSAPTITSFTATTSTITAGQSTTLSWTIAGASSVSLDNGIGDVSSVTSKSVAPAQSTTYTLTATNSAGTTVAHVTVAVTAPPPPTITYFTATPSTIAPGQFVTLSWSVSGATSLVVDHGIGDVTGLTSTSVSPAQNTVYTLYASNGATSTSGPATTAAGAAITVLPAVVTAEPVYQIRYLANLNQGDSYVNFTNAGTLSGFDPAGRICVNVYTFDPAEEMISCCACPVTPNGLNSLSARNDLISNTLTPGAPTSVTVKLVSSLPVAGVCNPSSPAATNLVRGLRAWATTLHLNTSVAPAPGVYQQTETPFSNAELSDSELTKLTSFCGFIQSNGSGFGICKSCTAAALGEQQK